jgi:Kdo2-lipid IVA lauroyltransferase/acyltransferase
VSRTASSHLAAIRKRLTAVFDAVVSAITVGLLRTARKFERKKTADAAAALLRTVGPWLPEHRTGYRNLKRAYPEKSDEEIREILLGVWDNLGRFSADFAHLDRIKVFDPDSSALADIEYSPQALARFEALKASGKPALLFTAHLANWELPAVVAHRYGLDTVVLYRRPNLGGVADAAIRIRAGAMGDLVASDRFAPLTLANALADNRCVGMLIDQYHTLGVEITFFGQKTRANPLLARIARRIDCPVHGTRVIRLRNNRFRIDVTDAIELPRDSDGQIKVADSMQVIYGVIESWIREHPEQWLWVHRRWRRDPPPRMSNRERLLQLAGHQTSVRSDSQP